MKEKQEITESAERADGSERTERSEQIRKQFCRLAEIGKEENGTGISRVFGSPFMETAQREVREYFETCGLSAWIDPAGNVHGLLKSGRKNAPVIYAGSHLDTVKEGGMFDGLLGVVAAAECAVSLQKEKIPLSCDFHVIATNGEEGNELGGTFGSRAMAGLLPLESAEYLEKAEKYGYTEDDLRAAGMDFSDARCWLELHIEQGPTLWKQGEQIGIVTGIVGLQRYAVTVYGKSNHAGTTMMEDRDDALVTAARLILEGDALARKTGHHFVETVGIMHVYPGSAPVIPDRVEMALEIRSEDESRMDSFMEKYRTVAEHTGKVTIEPIVRKAPVTCSSKIAHEIGGVCRACGASYRKMPSGATHDGNAMAQRMPVGMIFVPSVEGISHAGEEWTDWEDAERGMRILTETVKRLMEEEDATC
ncbi:MAG TPA: hydantoinase/carbamoylase family amidase [Candidatus Mediterraneibacter cottocaccae]|nr:hydantoinase/carbamoylase family amidase [Candidatus Mediterraneibacter cottocaccae]